MLSFTELTKPGMDKDAAETLAREILEGAVQPTQRRIIEVQDRMGDISKLFVELERRVVAFHKDITEAMGMGKGTLKQQIMNEVFKF